MLDVLLLQSGWCGWGHPLLRRAGHDAISKDSLMVMLQLQLILHCPVVAEQETSRVNTWVKWWQLPVFFLSGMRAVMVVLMTKKHFAPQWATLTCVCEITEVCTVCHQKGDHKLETWDNLTNCTDHFYPWRWTWILSRVVILYSCLRIHDQAVQV